MEKGYEFVQKRMKELAGSAGGGVLTAKRLVLEVYHPGVPSIDLVDLPGMTNDPKRSEDIKSIIAREVEECEKVGHSMYLAVVPSSDRPNTNLSMQYLLQHDLAKKSFGVLTSCDMPGRNDAETLGCYVLGNDIGERKKHAPLSVKPDPPLAAAQSHRRGARAQSMGASYIGG